RAGASRSVDRFLWIGVTFYWSFCTAFARLPRVGILANRSRITGVEKRGGRFSCESAEHCHWYHIRSVSTDLRSLCLAAETRGRNRTICRRMNDVRFPEARQDHPRKVAAGDYGLARLASELVVTGNQSRIENERRQFDHAHAHAAQTRSGILHQGIQGPAADDLRINCERAVCVSGAHQRAGGDCEAMEIVGQSAKD